MKKLVVLSGAGISAESGISTFRDSDGLWENHRIEDVASPKGWEKNPELVLNFYNQRRQQLYQVHPTNAHYLLQKLEQDFEVQIITQNVDDLHERAGSKNVLHLHGELLKVCSDKNKHLVYTKTDDVHIGDKATDGNQLRPFIVWFGEEVPLLEDAANIVSSADILLIIGTSMQVYPAAGLYHFLKPNAKIFIINPKDEIIIQKNKTVFIKNTACKGMQILYDQLIKL